MSLGITKASGLQLEPSSSFSLSFHSRNPRLSSKPVSPCFLKFRTQSTARPSGTATAAGRSFCSPTTTFYDLLGIPESVSPREIKQAYKQLVLKYHPDVSPPDRVEENTKRFILLQEAYETLSDPNSRALYDVNLASGSLLAFSSGKPFRCKKEGFDDTEKRIWKSRWESQLTELKRSSMSKDNLRDSMSWGAKIRRRRSSKAATNH